MDSKMISHVFGAVNSAERTMQKIEALLPMHGAEDIRLVMPQQKQIIKRMRRVANLLQLEAAKQDWAATVRSLRLFYGLHHMIRRDLIKTHKSLLLNDVSHSEISEENHQAGAASETSNATIH